MTNINRIYHYLLLNNSVQRITLNTSDYIKKIKSNDLKEIKMYWFQYNKND